MRKRWIEIVLHVVFWISTSWLITSSFSIQAQEIEIVEGVKKINIVRNFGLAYQLLLIIFISAVSFYFNAWLLLQRNRSRINRNAIKYSALIFALTLLVVYGFSCFSIFGNLPPIPKQLALGIAIFYFSLSVSYSLAKLWVYNNQRQHQLLVDRRQAELALLRNQLQPHFLFNALNNLLAMVVPSENPKLAESIEQLSQLLRFVIEGTKEEKVSIAKEIEFLRNYVALQKLRFNEDEVIVSFKVIGQNENQKVEPGLFIAFVENAFKYGTEPEKSSTIEIEFDLSKSDSIEFQIKNEVLMKHIDGVGTGIDSTQKRLELIYPGKHTLTVSKSDDFLVHLIISTI